MNMLVSHKPFTTTEEYLSEAKARRGRLWTAKEIKPLRIPERVPEWRLRRMRFDHHVQTYQMALADRMTSRGLSHMRRRCEEFGVPVAIMIGESRRKVITIKRQFISWELHTLFGLSFPHIGRIMGGRDHTTALYSFNKIEQMPVEERAKLYPDYCG